MRRILRSAVVLFGVTVLTAGAVPAAFGAPPTNDERTMATVIPGIPFSDAIDTTEATTAADDPDPDCVFGGQGPTVWYSFSPTATAFIGANTFGSNYDTTLAAYVEVDGALVQIACNDDSASTLQSRVRFDVEPGTTYLFMVGAFANGMGGNLTFNLIEAPPPVQIDLVLDRVGSVVPSTGVATLRGTITCTSPTGVFVDASLRQRVGRSFVDGFGFTVVDCDGTTPWSVEVNSFNGLFAGGRATASVFASAFEDDSFDFESATVRLRGSRR